MSRPPHPLPSTWRLYLGGSDGLGVSCLQLLQSLPEVLSQERKASSTQLPLILLTQAASQTVRRNPGRCLEDLTRGLLPIGVLFPPPFLTSPYPPIFSPAAFPLLCPISLPRVLDPGAGCPATVGQKGIEIPYYKALGNDRKGDMSRAQ